MGDDTIIVALTFYLLLPASSYCSWRCSITHREGPVIMGSGTNPRTKQAIVVTLIWVFFTILATDSVTYSDKVWFYGFMHNCTHKGYFSLQHMYCITTKDLYFLGTFCFSQGIISHLYTTTHITGTQWMCFPNKVDLFIF